jgi:hypothetical protein
MKPFEDLIQINGSATLKAKDNSSFSSPTQRLTVSGNAELMLHYTNAVVSNFPCLATKRQKFAAFMSYLVFKALTRYFANAISLALISNIATKLTKPTLIGNYLNELYRTGEFRVEIYKH